MGQALARITPESDDMVDRNAAETNFSPLSASVMRYRDGIANANAVGGPGMGGLGSGGGVSNAHLNSYNIMREDELDDARSIRSFDDDTVVTTHSFLESPALTKNNLAAGGASRKDLLRSVTKVADSFETFEFMLDTCVASVSTYGVGFTDDHRHQILKLRTHSDKLFKEEEYRRGLITNSMLTMHQIIQMAAAQVMPALIAISAIDPTETDRFKRQLAHRGRAGSFINPSSSLSSPSDLAPSNAALRSGGTSTVTIFQKDLNIKYRRGGNVPSTPLGNDYSPINSPLTTGGTMQTNGGASAGAPGLSSSTALGQGPPRPAGESPNADPKMVEFFKRLSGSSIDAFKYKAKPKVIPNWSLHTTEETDKAVEHLNRGDAYFHFLCSPLTSCNNEDLTVIQTFANVTNFEDEMRDNNCPVVDVFDEEQKPLYQVIGVKAMYILPGVDIASITKKLMATQEYNKACQPGDCKFFDVDTPFTFRQTKCVVKFVYTITVQFLVGEIDDPAQLEQFTNIEGVRPGKAIFLERTKRNVAKTDSTAKVRSILLYYPVEDGVYVSHHTVVMSTSIPGIVAKIVNNFGSQGAAESAETADLTRKFLLKTFGDTRR